MKNLTLNLSLGDSLGISEHYLYFKLINRTALSSRKYQDILLSVEVQKVNNKLGNL